MLQRRTFLLGLGGGLGFLAVGGEAAADELGRGRYARMSMRLEKTFLEIDVLDMEVIVSQSTAARLEKLVKRKPYSKELEESVVREILETTDGAAGILFLMDLDMDQFVDSGRESLKRALDAKMIDKAEYDRVYAGLPEWFGFLKDRGVREGDRLGYRGSQRGLRTLFHDAKQTKLLDMTHGGPQPLRTMLASYYPPGGEFRAPLVRSLFDERQASR
jgi:hypothetical protein